MSKSKGYPAYCSKCGSVMVHTFPPTGKFSRATGSKLYSHHFKCENREKWTDGHDEGDEYDWGGIVLYDDIDLRLG